MGINSRAAALAATVVGCALLVGIAAGPASAASRATGTPATARTATHTQVGAGCFDLVNETPYTWTLYPKGTVAEVWGSTDGGTHWQWIKQAWDGRAIPPQQVLPGQSVSSLSDEEPGDSRFDVWVSYEFQDADGGWHLAQAHRDTSYQLTSFSNDVDPATGNYTHATATFHMAAQPGGCGVGAYLDKPADITIDAVAHPDQAATVMAKLPQGTHASYTPTAPPTWRESDPVQGSARLINATSAPAELTATTGSTNSETTDLSMELSWSTKLAILDLANVSIAASVEGGHSFGVSTEVEDGNTMPVQPGRMGWFVKTTQSEHVTGDFVFTLNGNVTYHVKNATVSMPGVSKPGQGVPVPGTAFTPTDTAAPATLIG
jgi:hypothetical protein